MDINLFPYFLLGVKANEDSASRVSTNSAAGSIISKQITSQIGSRQSLSQVEADSLINKLVELAIKIQTDHEHLNQMIAVIQQNWQSLNKITMKHREEINTALYAMVKVFQNFLQRSQQIPQKTLVNILSALQKWKKILQTTMGFKLFLSLTQINLMHLLAQPFAQIISYFHILVSQFSLIEQYMKQNSQYFKVFTRFLRASIFILNLYYFKKVPIDIKDYVFGTGKELNSFTQKLPELSPAIINNFYDCIEKYVLIDPQFRLVLLKTMTELFKKRIQTEIVVELLKICTKLMHKKIFQHYETQIFQQMIQIKKLVSTESMNLFNKMIFVLIEKSSFEFLISYKKYILKLGISEETVILLFSQYYDTIFGKNNKEKEFDIDIFNSLVSWNVQYQMIPTQTFIPDILQIGLDKLSEASEKNICSSSVKGWTDLALKIVQNKCKQYLSGKLNFQLVINDQIFNKSTEVYTIYTKMFIQVLTNNFADKFKTSPPAYVNFYAPIETARKIREHSITIFQKAVINKIHDLNFVEPFCLLNSLIQTIQTIRLDAPNLIRFYNSTIKNLKDNEVQQFLTYLVQNFKIFKNSFLLFVILLCGINIFYKRPEAEALQQKFILVLQDINKLNSNEGYAKIVSYDHKNLQLLLLLGYKSQNLLKKCQEAIENWAALYNKKDIELLFYQFDLKLYGHLLEELQIQIKPEQQIQNYVFNTLHQILLLLLHPQCINTQYLNPFSSAITFLPIRHSNQKNSLVLQLKLLMNAKLCCNSIIQIYASPRKQSIGMQKHRIIFKNQKIIYYNRVTKQIQGSVQEISQSLYMKPFSLHMQFANGKLTILINKTELIHKNWQYLVDSIRFQLNGDIMVKQFKWQRLQQQFKQLNYNDHFQIFPSQAEIKLSKTQHFPIINFHDKLQIQQLCAYLIQLFYHTFGKLSANKYYGLCCDIILNKEGLTKNEYSASQFSFIRKLFKNMLQMSLETLKIDLPDRALLNLDINSKKCYQFLVSTVLNQPFLSQCTKQNQIKALKYLEQLLFGPKSNFRIAIENRKIRIFANLVKSAMRMTVQVQQKYLNLLEKVIMTHEANQTLLKKITFLFYMVSSTKSQFLTKFYDRLMGQIFAVANHTQNQQNYHIKVIGKYFLSSHKNLKQIFVMANKDIKTKILDSMIDDEQIHQRCHNLFQGIPPHQFLELSSWLIVYCKRTLFYFFDNKKQTKLNLANLIFLLKQITIAVRVQTDQEHKQQFLSILNTFTKRSIKLIAQRHSLEITSQIENFFAYENYIKLLGDKIYQLMQSKIIQNSQESFITNYFQVLFNHMPKHIILKALQQFRKLDEVYYNCCLYIIKLDYAQLFPIKTLSPFLQYLIEVILKLKASSQEVKLLQIGPIFKEYIQKSIKNYPKISKISSPFLYSYPKMDKRIQFKNINKVRNAIQKTKNSKQYELRGGVYFKLMVISLHLIQILPQQDLSELIIFFLDKIGEKSKSQPIFRAVSDFIQVSKQTKKRSSIDVAIQQVQKEHEKYFQEEDNQICIESSSPKVRRSNSKTDIQADLTPFFMDYFFMKIFKYLEEHCEKNANQQVLFIGQSYSKTVIKYLKQFEHISEEMSQKNVQSAITYETVDDIYELIQSQDNLITMKDKINSPSMNRRLTSNEDSNVNFGFLQINNEETDKAFLGTPVKKTTFIKRKSTLGFDLTSGKKKKKQLMSNIEDNIIAWSEEAKIKKAHRFFRDESKQILFNQLLHHFFVLESEANNFVKEAQITKGKRLVGFLSNERGQFVEQELLQEQLWQNKKKEVRKVHKFTHPTKVQIQVQRVLFPNQTLPITKPCLTLPSSQRGNIRSQFSNPSFSFSMSLSENQVFLNSPYRNIETIVCLANDDSIEQTDSICQISTPIGVYFCTWEIKNKNIVLITKAEKKAEGNVNKRLIKYGSPVCNIVAEEGKKFQIVPNDVLQIFYRKYNQVRNNSLQFFHKNGSSIYVIFYTQERAKKFIKQCKNKINQFRMIKIVQNYLKQFQNGEYTQKWVAGQMSNFDYLMIVNKFAGRTYCDLNQYYIFPWVLQDYTSNFLDISSSKIYRDLKKPIGALREEKLSRYLQKLSNISESKTDQYLYGSHYSTSLFIYYYLVRLQPFTSLHKDMQGGDFDAPDRLFSSMEQMWECLMSQSSTSDIKESIPEFYYFPTFLKNINNLNLGKKQSGAVVHHVELPPWASSPTQFILKMRICLQSDYVSSHLNHWIDLIFGKDQKSLQKHNVFHPLSYVQNINPQRIDIQNLDAIMSQITFFGQNPYPLFSKQHPKKKMKLSMKVQNNISLYTSLDLSKTLSVQEKGTKIYQEENLDLIYYVSSMQFKTKSIILMKISGISKSAPTRNIDLDMENAIHSLIRSIQKMDNPSMKRLLSQNNIEIPEQKISTDHKVDRNQIKICVGVKNQVQIVKSIKLGYKFQHLKYNEIVIVAYGSSGLRVYDWDQQVVWDYSQDVCQVSQCYLEHGVIFFATSNGKLFFYDFFSNHRQIIFEYSKPTYSLQMIVYPEKKLITKKNQNYYKFILVGDKRKIVLLHYTHKIGKIQAKY